MPKKIEEEVVEVVESVVSAIKGSCGHINKQFSNADGVREDLFCTLAAGHMGDHEADYACLRTLDGSIPQAKIISEGKKVLKISGKEYLEVVERAYWSDAAGTPAGEIRPDLAQLAQMKAQKGNMLDEAQIKRNANLA